MIDKGEINEELIKRTAKIIASFHQTTLTDNKISSFGSPDMIKKNTEENFSQTKDYVGRTIGRDWYRDLREFTRDFL